MTSSCRLNVGYFSFYSFKLRVSLHVAITLCRGKLIVASIASSSQFNYSNLMVKKSFTQPPSVVNSSSTAQIGVEQCSECYCFKNLFLYFCSLVSFCPQTQEFNLTFHGNVMKPAQFYYHPGHDHHTDYEAPKY